MMKSLSLHLNVFFILSGCLFISTSLASSIPLNTESEIKSLKDDDKNIDSLSKDTLAHDNNRLLNNSYNNNNNYTSNESSTLFKIIEQEQQRQQQQQQQRNSHQYHRQTNKSPRTIQRLIGGHLKHPLDFDSNKTNNQEITTTTPRSSTISSRLFRKIENRTSSVYRTRNVYRTINRRQRPTTSTTTTESANLNDYEDDEAYLEDNNNDIEKEIGIQASSTGDGKDEKTKSKKKLDANKTLAEQVRDGKYGLIEKELFQKEPKRPGIISYLDNKEFPNDNIKNLGGLQDDDIWLAEDHLLVLKGGGLNEKDNTEPWAPIDDHVEEERPIKLPDNPKIPPPFPVQLEESGPIQFIGNNQFPFFDPYVNQSLPIYSTDYENNPPPETISDYEKNLFARKGPTKNLTSVHNKGYFYPEAVPNLSTNSNIKNQTFVNPFLNPNLPVELGGLGGSSDNSSDYYDEDDPSLYYPPGYSFEYKSNYSNSVRPGPLVPGIILPPPPNAFSRIRPKTHKKVEEVPFRQVLTKISEYEPKTIIVTPSNAPTTKLRPTTTSTTSKPPRVQVDIRKEIIYAVTEPPPTNYLDKVRYYTPSTTPLQTIKESTTTPATQDQYISFVPQVETNTLSKSNPIYYEYYDARKTSTSTPKTSYINDYSTKVGAAPSVSTTTPIPQRKPITSNYYHTTKKQKHHKITTDRPAAPKLKNTYLPVLDEIVYITPKTELRPYPTPINNFVPIILKPKPSKNKNKDFEHEVNAIRETLQYYKNKSPPRVPKGKPVYEYSFDATKSNPNSYSLTREQNSPSTPQFDEEPFKPIVKYSAPGDEVNGFKAMHSKVDSTTNSIQSDSPMKLKSDRIRVKILYDPMPLEQPEYYSGNNEYDSPTTILTTQKPWVSIEKQTIKEIESEKLNKRRPSSRKIEPLSGKVISSSYGYNPPRQNSRYYEEPFNSHVHNLKAKLVQYQQQQQWNYDNEINTQRPIPHYNDQAQNYWSLENDTLINYIPQNRPPINPNAEFIRIPSIIQNSNRYEQLPPPPQSLSLQQQNYPSNSQLPWSLHNDTAVNYLAPRPPINPNAEFIPTNTHRVQQQQFQQYQQYQQYQQNQQNNYNQQSYYHRYQNQPQNNVQNQAQRLPIGVVLPGHSLARDTAVNYRKPLPQFNPNAEFIDPNRPIINHYRLPPQQQQYGPSQQRYDHNNYQNNYEYPTRLKPPK